MTGELFKMNAYGDIWQEPTLFDQGGDVPATTSTAPRDVNLCRAVRRRRHLQCVPRRGARAGRIVLGPVCGPYTACNAGRSPADRKGDRA